RRKVGRMTSSSSGRRTAAAGRGRLMPQECARGAVSQSPALARVKRRENFRACGSRNDLDDVRAERLGVIAAAIDGEGGVPREGHGVPDDLGAARAGGRASREENIPGGYVDCPSDILASATVEFERRAFGYVAITEHRDPGSRARPWRGQIDRGIAVDGCGRPAAAGLLGEDEGHAIAGERGTSVYAQTATVEIIDART